MRILDRYITDSMIKVFLGCIITFVCLYVIIDIFSHLDEILKHRLSLMILKEYYLSYLPIIFVQVAPIACLLATLYTLGNLSRHNEIIAMRTSGLSVPQIAHTMVLFGLLISIFVFLINEKIVPQSLNNVEKIKLQMQDNQKQDRQTEIIENLSMYGLKNRLFFVNRFSLLDKSMEGITILEQDQHQNLTKKIVANRGVWDNGLWKFYQSLTYAFDIEGRLKDNPQYLEEEIMDISESPADFLSQRRHPETMNVAQLEKYIFRLSSSGAETIVRNLKIDLYNRFTSPFTSLIIMLVGIPFALKIKGRTTTLSSFGVSFGLGFLYYALNAIAIATGKAGFLPALLAASLGHLIFLSLSIYLILTLS